MTYFHFLFLSGLMLSSVAAVFSVHGLAEMFSASYWSIVVMASVLELCKLVTASWLYNRWEEINKLFRVYLSAAVVILMLITSGGIFGVLSKAYLEKAQPNNEVTLQLNQVNKTIESLTVQVARNDLVMNQLNAQVDSFIMSGDIDKSSYIRSRQGKERNKLNAENASLTKEINELSAQKNALEFKKTQSESDIGPLKYLAAALYGSDAPVDKAVRLLIFALILVFDPLAVIMMMSATKEMSRQKKEEPVILTEEETEYKPEEVNQMTYIVNSPEEFVLEPSPPEVTEEPVVEEQPKKRRKYSRRTKKPVQLELELPPPLTEQEQPATIERDYKFNHVKDSPIETTNT